MSAIVVRAKIWLETDGHPFLGNGRYRLLQAIESKGSINAAAREMGISYRRAWAQLEAMEMSAPFPLVIRTVGGRSGGSSRLTPETKQLLRQYRRLRDHFKAETERCSAECFSAGEQRP
jgi:molybdate transport system regulatory protein